MSTTRTARQLQVLSPGVAEIVQVGLPPGQAGDLLVRARYSGISRGTEALVFNGRVPPSQYAAMRAPFQQGDYPGPVTCGYSSVGEVEETGAGAPAALAGRTVFCLHPHQDLYRVPACRRHACAGRRAGRPRGAGGQHGNRGQHHLGRPPGARRPHRRDRRRRRRPAGGVAVPAGAGRRGHRGRRRPGARGRGQRTRAGVRSGAAAGRRRGHGHPRQRPAGRPARRAGVGRRGRHDRGGELVRHARRTPAVGRGVPCPPP